MRAGGLGRLPGEETGVGETRGGDKGKRFLGARRGLPAPGLHARVCTIGGGERGTCYVCMSLPDWPATKPPIKPIPEETCLAQFFKIN